MKKDRALTRKDLQQSLSLSSMDLINGLQSLKRRQSIQTIAQEDIKFSLAPVCREYWGNCR